MEFTVGVVILARDESRCIARCLDSVVGSGFHDIVVADTGSVDATPRIVGEYRRLGVRSLRLPWQDSFAGARNAALAEIGTEWVVFLDADEWLAGDAAGPLLAELAAAHDVRGTVFAPRIIDEQTGAYVKDVPRIVPADGSITYRGRVHEYPVVSGPIDTPVRVIPLDYSVRHDGYHPDVMAAKNKAERNITLLRRARAEDPGNPRWLYFMVRNPCTATDRALITELCAELDGLAARDITTGDWHGPAEYYRWALAVACQALGGMIGDWDTVLRYCSVLDRIDGGTSPDAHYFRLLHQITRAAITGDDLLATINLRRNEELIARSTVCRYGRHLDALIVTLLEWCRGPDHAEEYRSMCAPWSDLFFAESRPRLATVT